MAVSSLIVKVPQIIQPGVYTALRFNEESTDGSGWHDSNNLASANSALIVPDRTAYAGLYAQIFWENALARVTEDHPDWSAEERLAWCPTQYQDRFSRDPYDADIDSTCTQDHAPTGGAQFLAKAWAITVRSGQPLAVMVAHNGGGPLAVTLAEFKVWIP